MLTGFSEWYRKNIIPNQTVVSGLFLWQVLHLYWLTTHVVAGKFLGYPIFSPSEFYQFLLIIADYVEIPALVSGTLFYLYGLNGQSFKKGVIFLILINSQWLHLFWITDEFVIAHFRGEHPLMPAWLTWTAICIDYLELPVIFDTMRNTVALIVKRWRHSDESPPL